MKRKNLKLMTVMLGLVMTQALWAQVKEEAVLADDGATKEVVAKEEAAPVEEQQAEGEIIAKEEAVMAEEPIAKEPVSEEPVVAEEQQADGEIVVKEEAVLEEPVTKEPVVADDQVKEEPVVADDQVKEEPVVAEEQVKEEPVVADDQVKEEPVVADDQVKEEPVAADDGTVKEEAPKEYVSGASPEEHLMKASESPEYAKEIAKNPDLFKAIMYDDQGADFIEKFADMYPELLKEMIAQQGPHLEVLMAFDEAFIKDQILSGTDLGNLFAELNPEYVDKVKKEYEDSINGGETEVADSGSGTTTGGDEGGGEATGEGGGGGATPAAANAVAAYCSDGTVLTIDPEMSASKYECNGRIVGYVAKSAESSDSNPFKSLNSVDGQ